MKLSNKAVGESNVGQMVNLLSNDVSRFESFTQNLHYLWLAPLQFSLIVYLSWQSIGNATFVGGSLLLLFVPFQSWMGKKFSHLRSKTAKKTDIRIRIMNEIIKGINRPYKNEPKIIVVQIVGVFSKRRLISIIVKTIKPTT